MPCLARQHGVGNLNSVLKIASGVSRLLPFEICSGFVYSLPLLGEDRNSFIEGWREHRAVVPTQSLPQPLTGFILIEKDGVTTTALAEHLVISPILTICEFCQLREFFIAVLRWITAQKHRAWQVWLAISWPVISPNEGIPNRANAESIASIIPDKSLEKFFARA